VPIKDWEIIADNLSKAGWSWGCVATVDREGERSLLRTRIAAMVNATLCTGMKKLSAFLDLERITHQLAASVLLGDDIH
jgi:hypothetical protein